MSQPKARGTIFTRAVRFLRRLKQESRQVLPEDLQHYLSEMIEPTGWYPEEDLQGLLRACIELMIDTPEPVALDEMGRWAAREHFSEIFPSLRKQPDSQTLIRKFPIIWKDHHDTGAQRFVLESPTRGRMEIGGYRATSPMMCALIASYNAELMRLAGWGEATVTRHDCVAHGSDHCTWYFNWGRELGTSLAPPRGDG